MEKFWWQIEEKSEENYKKTRLSKLIAFFNLGDESAFSSK